MTCPKCNQEDLYPDHDRRRDIECYFCPICGYRHYPLYPRRIRAGIRPAKQAPITGTACVRCGAKFPKRVSRKMYCETCKKALKRELFRGNWERHKEAVKRQRRSHALS